MAMADGQHSGRRRYPQQEDHVFAGPRVGGGDRPKRGRPVLPARGEGCGGAAAWGVQEDFEQSIRRANDLCAAASAVRTGSTRSTRHSGRRTASNGADRQPEGAGGWGSKGRRKGSMPGVAERNASFAPLHANAQLLLNQTGQPHGTHPGVCKHPQDTESVGGQFREHARRVPGDAASSAQNTGFRGKASAPAPQRVALHDRTSDYNLPGTPFISQNRAKPDARCAAAAARPPQFCPNAGSHRPEARAPRQGGASKPELPYRASPVTPVLRPEASQPELPCRASSEVRSRPNSTPTTPVVRPETLSLFPQGEASKPELPYRASSEVRSRPNNTPEHMGLFLLQSEGSKPEPPYRASPDGRMLRRGSSSSSRSLPRGRPPVAPPPGRGLQPPHLVTQFTLRADADGCATAPPPPLAVRKGPRNGDRAALAASHGRPPWAVDTDCDSTQRSRSVPVSFNLRGNVGRVVKDKTHTSRTPDETGMHGSYRRDLVGEGAAEALCRGGLANRGWGVIESKRPALAAPDANQDNLPCVRRSNSAPVRMTFVRKQRPPVDTGAAGKQRARERSNSGRKLFSRDSAGIFDPLPLKPPPAPRTSASMLLVGAHEKPAARSNKSRRSSPRDGNPIEHSLAYRVPSPVACPRTFNPILGC
ncbi:hypothetical protein DIPPA_14622 [Diplonema papillatum]|nr:hypothetical protein DIPPA_14622 [Diplonema papillatum]KAJ9467184.1 hypothetical protein DIPPA_14622 [Diplonema papillatum]